jgi:asparagine N-glycosylation enzyme membrane subunit Stt3
MCVLIWGITLLYATVMHVRYEYYAGVVIVLFSSITLSAIYDWIAIREIRAKEIKKDKNSHERSLSVRAIV